MEFKKLIKHKQESISNLNKRIFSNRKLLVVFVMLGIIIITLGASLAFFTYSRIGNNLTTITSGDIEFSFVEGKSATLTNAFPVSDTVGAADTTGEYTFDVKLKSSSPLVTAKYVVSLISNNDGEKDFNNEHIKYNLQRNGEFVVGSVEKGELLSTIEGFDQGETNGEGIIVFNQAIEANKTDTYKLRIWIDENVNYSNTVNGQDEQTSTGKYNSYNYSLKAKVEASVENVYGYGLDRKVELDANGGKIETSSITVLYGGTFGNLPTPTRQGYVFGGWYTEKEGGVPVTSETYYKEVEVNKIYARWLNDKLNVVIDPNGGTYENSTSTTSYILEYQEEKEISIPERTGYNFAGWTLTGEGSSIENNTFKMGHVNATLKAKWENKEYTLTIDPNNGSWNNSNESQEFKIKYLDTKNIAEPTRDGHVFTGWQVSGENASFTSGVFTMGTSDATLTATWQTNDYTYIVKHYQQNIDGNGYTLVDTDTSSDNASFGSSVTPDVKSYVGFTSPSKKTLTITSDGAKNIVEYQYTRNKYNLVINPNGGKYNNTSENTTINMYYQSTKEIINPERTGYVFTNWTVSSGDLDDKMFTISSGDAELTANWQAEDYIITYDGNGGTPTKTTDQVTYNAAYKELANASRDGYTFAGWYTEKDGGELVTEETIVKTASDHTLYAHWTINTYQLTVRPNFGTWENSPSNQTFNIEYLKTKEISKPTRVGYTFSGWTLDGTGSMISETSVFTMGYTNATLTANWIINSYKLTVDPNGGEWTNSSENQEFVLNYLGTKEIIDPTRDGYTFTGWEVTGTNANLSSNTFTIGESDATLKATWEVNSYKYITKHYQQNVTASGYTLVNGDTTEESANFGSNVTPPVNTYTGFTSPTPKTLTITSDVAKNLVEYQYARNKYNLTVKPNGGKYNNTTSDTVTQMYYQASTSIANPERVGYTFKNWTASSGSINDKVFTMGSENATLTANWDINSYTLTVNPNGGSWNNSSENQTFELDYQGTKEITKPERSGYTFDGWTVSGTNSTISGTTFKIGEANATLTAKWKANEYTVTYDANGGTVTPTSDTVTFDSNYGSLPRPSRNGYTFNGWFNQANGGTQIVENTTVTTASNHSIYAHWNINNYTLTVKPNGGTWNSSTSDQTFTLNYQATKEIAIPTRTGYTFDKWTLSGTESTMTSLTGLSTFKMGYQNASLTANWKINSYSLTVNPNGGTWNNNASSQNFTLDYKGTKEIADPVRDGYTFTGWEVTGTNASLNSKTFTIGEANATLKATWKVNSYAYITKHYQQNVTATGYTLVSGDTSEASANFGTQVTPPVKTYTGFTSPSTKTLTITSDTTKNLVEYQYARKQYTLTIKPNGGTYNNTTSDTVTKMYYQATATINNPTRTGYTFNNWTVSSGTLTDKVFKIAASNATLTANWTANEYTVTFNARGGTTATASKKVAYDSTYGTLPTPVRDGYSFQGWFTAETGGTQITDTTKISITGNQTLYAHWLSSDAGTVTYSNPDYTDCTTMECAFDELYNKLNNLD